MEKGITVKEGVVEEDITGSLLHLNTLEGMTGETPSHGRRPDYNDREAVGYERQSSSGSGKIGFGYHDGPSLSLSFCV